jgi:hypothetical protein
LLNAIRENAVMVENGLALVQVSISLVKVEPDSCTESSVTSHDDECECVGVKAEEDTDGEFEQDPVAITCRSITSEHVSFSVSIVKPLLQISRIA